MDETRLIAIETKITFQEDLIKELNDVICEQQKQIDTLEDTCKMVVGQLNQLLGKDSENEKDESPPPHY